VNVERIPNKSLDGGEPTSSQITISRMTDHDLAEVMQIEKVSFSTPWSKGMFLTELRDNPFSRLLVAKPDPPAGKVQPAKPVVGYCCFWIIFGEVHIMNLAVRPDWRKRGIASRLVEETLSICRQQGVKKIHLEVRESNDLARRLYEKFGFRVVTIRPNYYSQPRENAILMALELD